MHFHENGGRSDYDILPEACMDCLVASKGPFQNIPRNKARTNHTRMHHLRLRLRRSPRWASADLYTETRLLDCGRPGPHQLGTGCEPLLVPCLMNHHPYSHMCTIQDSDY